MYDYDFFSFESKADFLRRSEEFWNPDKTRFWQDAGVDLVIDRREGYLFWDMGGRRLIDLHLNGGTYNLGHRNPELIAVLEQAMGRFDIGNHHFPALARTALAEALVATCGPGSTSSPSRSAPSTAPRSASPTSTTPSCEGRSSSAAGSR